MKNRFFKKTIFLIFFFLFLILPERVFAQSAITNIEISPNLDISYFDSYTLFASISGSPSSVTLDLVGLNGDTGATEWNFYADGREGDQTLSYSMSYFSGTTWRKTTIRPDHIYPEILFAPSSITWANTPLNINIRRNNYHILSFKNPFTMVKDMNFWIEINAEPLSTVNSADLLVYLVKKDKTISFFQSDWRSSSEAELVGTINRNTVFHHEHSDNSSHYLIRLSTDDNGYLGTKDLNINDDFWLILYDTSPNTNRGWNLKYHGTSLCDNTNGWYQGNQTGWTTAAQAGCPDVHVHFARRSTYADGVRATVTADGTTETKDFSFATLPNLAPNGTNFTSPVRGVYSGTFNITWNEASDPNGDSVKYNLYLLDANGDTSQTLTTATTSASLSWNTSDGETDGEYTLKGQACDASLCTDFYSQPFSLNNAAASIYSLTSITMTSNNSDSTKGTTGDTVTLSFVASGAINTPTVAFYSGGAAVANTATVTNTGSNNWTATYLVGSGDTDGQVTFTISSTNLDLEYSEVTTGSYVTIDIPEPTSTPAPTIASSIAGISVCGDSKPRGIPNLFQIDVFNTKATVYFTSVSQPVSDYYLAFSEESNRFQHGTYVGQNWDKGVLAYTVYYLKPNTVYYFRVRPQNGCSSGDYGQEMKIKTGNRFNFGKTIFYKKTSGDRINKNKVVAFVSAQNITPAVSTTPTLVPEKTTGSLFQSTNRPFPRQKKRCFLWWCF